MTATRSRRPSRDGFTLIEMAVVVLVVGVLAAISIQQYNRAQIQAQAAALSHDLTVMEDEILEQAAYDLDAVKKVHSTQLLEELLGHPVVPSAPETMKVVASMGIDGTMNVFLVGTTARDRTVLDELAKMRPLTANESSGMVIELIDVAALEMAGRRPAPQPSGGGGGTGSGTGTTAGTGPGNP